MTPSEIGRMWNEHFNRNADTMDNVATAIFWIRSMLDSKVTYEDVRSTLGWATETDE